MKFSAVIFDFDGTLVETSEYILGAYNNALTNKNYPPVDRKFIAETAGVKLSEVFKLTGVKDEAELAEMMELFYAFQKNNNGLIKAFPDSMGLLRELRESGIKVGIVTARRSTSTQFMLEHTQLVEFIDAAVYGDTFPEGKHTGVPFLECAKRLSVEPAACLAVGDGCVDNVGGKAAGMKTALAKYGYGALAPCSEKFDYELDSLADLLKLL